MNDHLYTGPDVLNSLIGILIRFRQERIAVVGDVEAMYHRVQVYDEDQQFLRFLWWKDGNIHGPIEEFCMKVQVFGSGPSGFCANTALRRCADDGIGRFPEHVIKSVHTNFYVNDLLMSLSDDKSADFVNAISRLLAEGGFRLHKWMVQS